MLYLNLANILCKQEQFEEAKKYYQKCADLQPNREQVYLYLGDICFSNNEMSQAIQYYHQYLEKPEASLAESYFNHILKLGFSVRDSQEKLKRFRLEHSNLVNLLKPHVHYNSIVENVYHCCAPRTASQWLKKILVDFRVYQYSGLAPFPVGLIEENTQIPQRTIQTGTFPISYEQLLKMQKPEAFKAFFVIRDPRDLVVSSYFANRYSHVESQSVLKNRQKLSDLPIEEGILCMIDALEGLFKVLQSWAKAKDLSQNIKLIRYEDLTGDNQLSTFKVLFKHCDIAIPENLLIKLLEDYKFNKLSGGRNKGDEDYLSHYRKGVAGDWRNYFNDSIQQKFYESTGNLTSLLGYSVD